MAHTRLAIVDPSGGQQPMRGEDRRTLLVCNGEIYNHRRLRENLRTEHRFSSDCDSEVVLHLYEEMGADCVRLLDGMFAFFVSNGREFAAARDPFGIKPLYLGRDRSDGLWFASEVKALYDRCVDIHALRPGAMITDRGIFRSWFAPTWTSVINDRSDTAAAIEHLEAAVDKRLMSDVPVGAFLSGGLDSSAIVALARRQLPTLKTFAVGVEGAPDLEAARSVARSFGTQHHECVYTPSDVERELERIVYHLESYDPALIRSAVPCYFVSRLAAEHVKVVLTGEGADELFAGYRYFGRFRDGPSLQRECVKLLLGLHAMNLQRVDRMTMAHGLEGRVPFLDVALVDWAMNLDPRLKLHAPGVPEKQLLRQALSGVVPNEALLRPKQEFAEGAGAEAVLVAHAERMVSDFDFARARSRFPLDTPVTKEEFLYRAVFEDLFPSETVRRTVSRWRGSA